MVSYRKQVGTEDHRMGPGECAGDLVQDGRATMPSLPPKGNRPNHRGDPARRNEPAVAAVYRQFPDETPDRSRTGRPKRRSCGQAGQVWAMPAHLLRNQDALRHANLLADAAELVPGSSARSLGTGIRPRHATYSNPVRSRAGGQWRTQRHPFSSTGVRQTRLLGLRRRYLQAIFGPTIA